MKIFTFMATHNSEHYDVAAAISGVTKNSQKVQGKIGRAFPSQNLYNTKDNVVLKVLLDFSQT